MNIAGFDFSRFDPDQHAPQEVLESVNPGKFFDQRVLAVVSQSFSDVPVEVVSLRPGTTVSLPSSAELKKVTTVRFAGKSPTVVAEPGQFGVQMVMQSESVVEVVFYTDKNPDGKVKIYTSI